jgi:DNA-binding NarL/FixJ family response regulator
MNETVSPVRTVLVEDDRVYRSALRQILDHQPPFRCAAEYDHAAQVLRALDRPRPPWDLVLMDLHLPDGSGIDATREIKQAVPDLPVVVVTVFDEPATILSAICAGADGYVLKSTPLDEMIDLLSGVLRGGSSVTPEVARTVLALVREATPSTAARSLESDLRLVLSQREQDVLREIARGQQAKQIAADLEISVHTVRTYVRRIYEKLHVATLPEAVAAAIRAGLV